MDEQLTVLAPGSFARLGNHQVRINGFRFYDGGSLEYFVVWWLGSTRHEQWVQAGEVSEHDGTPRRKIGFAAPAEPSKFPRLAG